MELTGMSASVPPHGGALRLFIASAGYNGRLFPQHAFAWRLENADGDMLEAGATEQLVEGSHDKGFYGAILAALKAVPIGSQEVSLVVPKGSEPYWVFMDSPFQRQQAGYRKNSKGGKVLRPNHQLIREVDEQCATLGLRLFSREPGSGHEIETRFSTEDAARKALREGKAALDDELLR